MDIKSFAEAIGVSTATVSRAFGGAGRISDETRRKVLEAAEKMGYHASFHARNLGSRRGGSIAFFYPELYTDEPDYFINEIVIGINSTLKHDRLFTVTPFDEDDERLIANAREQILDGRVSGAIIISGTAGAASLITLAQKTLIPYVVIGKSNPNSTKFCKSARAVCDVTLKRVAASLTRISLLGWSANNRNKYPCRSFTPSIAVYTCAA